MLKAIKVVESIPARKRGAVSGSSITQEMADEFARSLMMAQGKWVQYFEEPYSTAKESDKLRMKARNMILSAAMKPYAKRIEYTTRQIDGKCTAFARWI